jgi:hypothetical protein
MGHLRRAFGLSLVLFFAAGAPAPAEDAGPNASAYTQLDLAACRAVPPDPDDPLESGAWWCTGHRGIPVYVAEGDLRFFVSYGEGAVDEPAAATTLPAFNHVGGTIEWRLAPGGEPVATILRFHTDPGDGGPKGQVLVVTRLGGGGQVCHAGYVDALATRDANRVARAVADNAASFDCTRDTPVFVASVADAMRPAAPPPPAVPTTGRSVYTPLDLDRCRALPPHPDDPLESGAWWCDGHAGIPVHVSEGDLRFFVSYGADAPDQPAAATTLPAFNHLGPTIEWRLDAGGTPQATILRWFTSAGDGGPDGQTLVVTRLGGPGQVCHVGYVDARLNPDANDIARSVADAGARDFDCAAETPLRYGLAEGDARE